MNIAILGAQGFIGSHVFRALTLCGHNTTKFTNVVFENLSSIQVGDFDWILNFAGKTSIMKSFENAIDIYKSNLDIAFSSIKMASASGAALLNVSSYVYGNVSNPPAKESDDLIAANPYMGSKIAVETILTDLATQLEVDLVSIRPSNIYGHGQREAMLVASLIKSANEFGEITVNDPDPKRDYLYIEDFCACIASLIEKREQVKGQVFNIGSGMTHTNFEVAEIVRQEFNIEKPVRRLNLRRRADVIDGSIDSSKIQKAVNWRPKYSLVEGISETRQKGFGN